VNAGAEKPYTDKAGQVWSADQAYSAAAKWGYVGGQVVTRDPALAISGTDAPEIYRVERYSMDAYQFDLPNGKYTVRLCFAETYEGVTKAGERLFSVKIQGKTVLKDLDVLKEAGGFAKPLLRTFKGVAVTDRKLRIEFVPNVQNPEINGIVVRAE
jgi:endoglucanase